MPFKGFTFKGLDNYTRQLAQLRDGAEEMCKKALYEGAAVVADTIRNEIDSIPNRAYQSGGIAYGLTKVERNDLKNGLGITPIRDQDGVIDVKIGFDGYGRATKSFPQGVPVALTARSCCKGTSWLQKYDFLGKAQRRSQTQAEAKITETFNRELEKLAK